jgi:hypothetical protein
LNDNCHKPALVAYLNVKISVQQSITLNFERQLEYFSAAGCVQSGVIPVAVSAEATIEKHSVNIAGSNQ